MHQITYGETHNKNIKKTIVHSETDFDVFFKKNKFFYESVKNKNILHKDGQVLKNNSINYLSIRNDNNLYSHFKAILTKECNDCNQIYPYLSDIFLDYYFLNKKSLNKNFVLNKKILRKILKEEKNENIKSIISLFVENFSLEYFVSIEKSNTNEIILEKSNKAIFKNNFDNSFFPLLENNFYEYFYCIIDGFIDKVSEIHHLLQMSTENIKNTYVVFCYGMSEEVKRTIQINNKKKLTNVLPISFEYDENNLNLLNDIAVLHNSDVISAQKGQTISQAVRQKLKKGKHININKINSTLSIEPLSSREEVTNHIKMLSNKLKNTNITNVLGKNIISNRIKSIGSKNLKIYLPEDLYSDEDFNNKLNYYFSLFSKSNLKMQFYSINKEKYCVPTIFLNHAYKKSNSLKQILNNIATVIEVK